MKPPRATNSQKINDLVSELFSGKTLHDAESDDETTGVKLAEFDNREHDGSDNDQLDNQLSEFRKKNLILLNEVDAKYRGSLVSRKDLDDEGDEEFEEGEEDIDSEQSSGEDSVEQSEDENDDEQIEDDEKENSEAESETEDSERNENDQGNKTIFSKTSTGKSDEIRKGLAVQNQLKVWEHLLEVRIHSQKLVAHANSLPPHDILHEMIQHDDGLDTEIKSLQSGVLNLLDNLCDLQRTLVNGFPDTKSLEMQKPHRKRKYEDNLNEYADAIELNYNKYKPYADATIQKWYDRTKVFTNNLKSNSTEDANIIRRINTVLVNKEDLVKKSQLHKGGYELYNPDLNKSISVQTKEKKVILDAIETEDNADISTLEKNVYSTEIYDDTDFYHQLLRGLIEFKTSTLTNPQEISKQFAELEKLRKKMKKVVDTRASKGRKLRYVVHKKLVNFMAPNPHCEWTNEARDELYTSLFGKLDNKMVLNDG